MLNSRNKEHIFFNCVVHSESQWINILTPVRSVHWRYVLFLSSRMFLINNVPTVKCWIWFISYRLWKYSLYFLLNEGGIYACPYMRHRLCILFCLLTLPINMLPTDTKWLGFMSFEVWVLLGAKTHLASRNLASPSCKGVVKVMANAGHSHEPEMEKDIS
jgi:hypothetical protein